MKCPHCGISFHAQAHRAAVVRPGVQTHWAYENDVCPACSRYVISLHNPQETGGQWLRVFPAASARAPAPSEVPRNLAADYEEASQVIHISPKAAAALARRCLQGILRAQGYKARDLAAEVDLLLNEPDPAKSIPIGLRETVDAVRNFGNFSAHPITDVTQLQLIDVEPEEAEWCLEIVEELFQHFYVRPAEAAARKAALNAKLAAAGKPPSK